MPDSVHVAFVSVCEPAQRCQEPTLSVAANAVLVRGRERQRNEMRARRRMLRLPPLRSWKPMRLAAETVPKPRERHRAAACRNDALPLPSDCAARFDERDGERLAGARGGNTADDDLRDVAAVVDVARRAERRDCRTR